MTDPDLEVRLRTHLHRRFDGAQPPSDLVAGIQQVLGTRPRSVGLGSLLIRRRPGWTVLAAAAAVAALAFAGLRFGFIGPGDRPTPSPAATQDQGRDFVLLPPFGTTPAKADGTLASDVIGARLRALIFVSGFSGAFSMGGGYGITVHLPSEGPSGKAVRDVLEATGEVAFVPLPADDYGDGKLVAEVGQPLPKDEPALFGWDGIATVDREETASGFSITINLKPAAQDALEAYSMAHVGETMAIVVDDVVAMLPTINEPLTDGLQLTGPSDEAFAVVSAILIGGMMLPESWRGASSPPIVTRDTAIVAAITQFRAEGARVDEAESADLSVIADGRMWLAVWDVVLTGEFPQECLLPASATSPCATTVPGMLVTIDADNGTVWSADPQP